MSKSTSPAVISGIGFNAHQVAPGWWQIVTNLRFHKCHAVSDRFYGDAQMARTVLREWRDLYEAGRPRAGERTWAA